MRIEQLLLGYVSKALDDQLADTDKLLFGEQLDWAHVRKRQAKIIAAQEIITILAVSCERGK
jgi:hypothetical protein